VRKSESRWMRFESISNKASVAWLLFRESLRSFSANRNLGSAAGLAYYGFLSLMPLLLLAIFALGRVIRSSEDAFAGMAGLLTQMFPAFSQAILQDLMYLAQQRAWGVLSIVLLLWSITPFAGAIRGAVAYIFKTERKLHFVLAKLLDLAAVIALLVLFVSLVAGRVYYNMQTGAWLDPTVIWDDVLAQALGVLLTVLVLAFFFFVFAPVRLPWTHLGAGAIVTTLLFSSFVRCSD